MNEATNVNGKKTADANAAADANGKKTADVNGATGANGKKTADVSNASRPDWYHRRQDRPLKNADATKKNPGDLKVLGIFYCLPEEESGTNSIYISSGTPAITG